MVRDVAARYGAEAVAAVLEVLGTTPEDAKASAEWSPAFTAKVRGLTLEDLADRSVPETPSLALLKEQGRRFENAMACERKWKLDEFKTTIVTHKVLGKLARRILWGTYSTAGALLAAFRVEPDGSFVNALGGALDAMEAHVGIVHPATLEAGDRSAWSDVFRQQNLQQPFEQLTREVFTLSAEEEKDPTLERYENRVADTAKVLQLLDRGWRFGDRDEGVVVACLERQFGLSLIAGLRIHDGIRPDDRGGEPKRQRLGYADFGPTKPSYDVARSNDITLGAISVVVCCEVLRDLESLGATKA